MWGVDASAQCGDGYKSPTTKPPIKPDQCDLLAGIKTLKAGQLDDYHSQVTFLKSLLNISTPAGHDVIHDELEDSNEEDIESEIESLWTIDWDEAPWSREQHRVKHQEFGLNIGSEYSYSKESIDSLSEGNSVKKQRGIGNPPTTAELMDMTLEELADYFSFQYNAYLEGYKVSPGGEVQMMDEAYFMQQAKRRSLNNSSGNPILNHEVSEGLSKSHMVWAHIQTFKLTCSMEDTMKKNSAHKLEETKGLWVLVKDMNIKLEMSASAVLATDECHKEIEELQSIIQGISKEGQTLQSLVTNIKASGVTEMNEFPLIIKVLRILKVLWQTWMQGSPIIKMPHRDLYVTSQVSKIQNSQDVHGHILHMSAKELPPAYAFLPTGPPAHQQLYAQIMEEDGIQTPCVEVNGALVTIVSYHEPPVSTAKSAFLQSNVS
ncbi:hypothetical protein BDR06DRAFT_966355 [Suillus hirtellus]|nr:hypothetical protein BDR06DRAFT_966355 [Suillus hirtellus]